MRFGFFKIRKFIIATSIAAIALGAGSALAVKMLSGGNVEEPEEYVDNQTALLPRPTDGTKPSDHSILENLQIAAGVIHDNPHFRSISEGHAVTTMVIQNDQFVYTERFVDGDESLINTVSASSFKKYNAQKYTNGGQKFFYREGKSSDKDMRKPVWDEKEPVAYTKQDFLTLFGWTAGQMNSYIYAEDTIDFEKSKVVPSSEYAYEAEVTLDLVKSISQTKREVKFNGGAVSYPDYSQVKVSFAMDDDWTIRKMVYHDIYDVTVKMGVVLTAPVDSKITEMFYYDNYAIDQGTRDFYAKYADLGTSSGDSNIPQEKNAMDYISESMLGMALAGSTLDVNVKVDGDYDINGKIYAKFNIKTSQLKFAALFNDFYIKYDKELYVSYRKYNYMLDENYFNHVLEILNIDINELMNMFSGGGDSPSDSSSSDDSDGLMSQLSNLTLDKSSDIIKVSGGLNLDGNNVSFVINMDEDEEGAILKSIEVDALVDGKVIKGTIEISDKSIVFEDKEYVDLSNTSWFIDEMINIVSYKGYQYDMSYTYKDYDVVTNVLVDGKYNAKVSTTIKYPNKDDININLSYYEDDVYFVMGNIALCVAKEDSEVLIDLIREYITKDNYTNYH